MVKIGYGPGAVSPAALRTDPRARRRVWVAVALMAVVGLAVTTWSLVSAYGREAPLRGKGLVSAQAQVLAFHQHRKGPDQVQVRYPVPGRGPVTASVDVTQRFTAGTTTTVLYDPADPGTVRTGSGWRPVYRPVRLLFPVGAAVVLVVAVLGARSAHRAAAGV